MFKGDEFDYNGHHYTIKSRDGNLSGEMVVTRDNEHEAHMSVQLLMMFYQYRDRKGLMKWCERKFEEGG